MASIAFDSTSGILKTSLVWNVSTASFADRRGKSMYCLYVRGKETDLYECTANPKHQTDVQCTDLVIDLFGGTHVPYDVPMGNHGYTVISDEFAKMLKQSGLTGFRVRDVVKIGTNQTSAPDPKLFLWDITGRGGHVKRCKVIGEPHNCPCCNQEPMVCPGCGQVNDPCFNCGKRTLINPSEKPGVDEKRVFYHPRNGSKIVEAVDWDGSDWFTVTGVGGGPFVIAKQKNGATANESHT